jgi:CheY-like chemotaxis protein
MTISSFEQYSYIFLVVDDHEAILEGTIPALKVQYPGAEVITAKDRDTAQQLLVRFHPDLVMIDLSLPERPTRSANPEIGIQWIDTLMRGSATFKPNILVLSTNIKPLVRLTPMINTYEGGFAAMDKSHPIEEMLKLISEYCCHPQVFFSNALLLLTTPKIP